MRRSHPKFTQMLAVTVALGYCNVLVAQVQTRPFEAPPLVSAPATVNAVVVRSAYPATDAQPYAGSTFQATDTPAVTPPNAALPTAPSSQLLPFEVNAIEARSIGAQLGNSQLGGSQSSSPPLETNVPAGNRLLADAVANIASHRSIAANIRHRISLFGHDLVGSGTYQQMDIGQDRLLRLELKIPLDDQITSITQICDARFLWTQRTMPDSNGDQQTEISRIDLNRIQRAARIDANANGSRGQAIDTSNGQGQRNDGVRTPSVSGLLIGQGGLPQLMVELEQHFDFQHVHPATLQNVPVWMTSGTWKPAARAMLFPAEKDSPDKEKRLPVHVPEYVSVVLGREDLLPYQIEYRRKKDSDSGELMLPLDDNNSKSILTMELFRVEVGGAIDPNQFTFNAANRRVIDRTNDYLSQLRPTTTP